MPPEIQAQAELLAAELGTTTNDALIRLAGEGAAARERRARIAEIAAARAAAIDDLGGIGDAAAFPDPDELRDAMLSGRRDADA